MRTRYSFATKFANAQLRERHKECLKAVLEADTDGDLSSATAKTEVQIH